MTRKIVINCDYGGFSVSDECLDELRRLHNNPDLDDWELKRDDPELVRLVETMGQNSYGRYAHLKIVEIPEDVDWILVEYDGMEHVAERHRIWR